MIDALFGSKTRVKLLYLFLSNPGQAFYVREITRLIGEQINSVRRELANMLEVGIITSNNMDNKLYYEVNQRYEYYVPMRAIFAEQKVSSSVSVQAEVYEDMIQHTDGVRVAITAGVLVSGSASKLDLLMAGDISRTKVKSIVSTIEQAIGREITYSVLPYDELYYRLSVHDKFITDMLGSKHRVVVDADNIIKTQ